MKAINWTFCYQLLLSSKYKNFLDATNIKDNFCSLKFTLFFQFWLILSVFLIYVTTNDCVFSLEMFLIVNRFTAWKFKTIRFGCQQSNLPVEAIISWCSSRKRSKSKTEWINFFGELELLGLMQRKFSRLTRKRYDIDLRSLTH